MARAVRALVHAALASLATTWIVAPDRTGVFFGVVLGVLVAALLLLARAARTRPGLARVIHRARRGLDLAALAFVLSFSLAEVELRLIARVVHLPLLAPPDARADEVIRAWRLKPGQPARGTFANAQGFLDGPFAEARRPGTKRIVALADSFGVGVVDHRDLFLTQLDELLDQNDQDGTERDAREGVAPADRVEVLNFSVISTSPREYLQLWRTEAVRYEPDLVLLCFFVGNDWGVAHSASLLHAESTFLVTFVRRFIALANERRNTSDPAAAREHAASARGSRDELPTLSPESFARIERDRMELARRVPSRSSAAKFDETFALFETIVAEIAPRLRVVIIPDEYQVNDDLFASLAGSAAADFDRARPSDRLAEWLAARRVGFLDLREVLRDAQQAGATYRERDTHWNERGNAVAARAIAEWVGPQLR